MLISRDKPTDKLAGKYSMCQCLLHNLFFFIYLLFSLADNVLAPFSGFGLRNSFCVMSLMIVESQLRSARSLRRPLGQLKWHLAL